MDFDLVGERTCMTNVFQCAPHTARDDTSHFITALQSIGCAFLTITRDALDPDPLAYWQNRDWVYMPIEHPLLARDMNTAAQRSQGSAKAALFVSSRYVSITQRFDSHDRTGIDAAAHGQLALVRRLLPLLKPVYGYIDIADRAHVGNRTRRVARRRYRRLAP